MNIGAFTNMVSISAEYEGNLRTKATHEPSGATLLTDAPVDNQGKGESFAPTDLIGTALVTCVSTMMGIQAKASNINLEGMRLGIKKVMSTEPPRRIGEFAIDIYLPNIIDKKDQGRIEKAAARCPVIESLHPDIKKTINFHWKN